MATAVWIAPWHRWQGRNRCQERRLKLTTASTAAQLLLHQLCVGTLRTAFVEVLDLRKIPPLGDELLEGWGVLADAIPAAGRIADAVLGVGDPVLALLGDIHDLVHAHQAVPRGVYLLEESLVHPHTRGHVVHHKLVEQRLRHHRGRRLVRVEAELVALGIVVTAMVREDGVADPGQMRRFGKVISITAGPDKYVVGHVADRIPSPLLRACQGPAKGGDVLVVPCVAVRDRGPFGDAGNLVPVVPPGHHTRISGRVLLDPLVALQVVIDLDHLPRAVPDLVNHLGIGERMSHAVAVPHEGVHLQPNTTGKKNHEDH
mmetsp:Transcript_4197/g.9520  ORF Transcript_4197/g.9520 Transcript_4197/m.9520 type:complete len:316 (-) Transcript_4197:1873-2820(-)